MEDEGEWIEDEGDGDIQLRIERGIQNCWQIVFADRTLNRTKKVRSKMLLPAMVVKAGAVIRPALHHRP